ncbi:MAG: DUF2652 domain-containing protein [Gaiellaceae bacterium]
MATGLSAAERGCLLIADVSGYTSLLLASELEHAEDALNDLIGRVVASLEPVLTLSELEGDAAFAYVLYGTFSTSTLLDTVDRAYDAFRRRLRDIQHGTTCTCNACVQIPSLDLKFVLHDGQFVRRGDKLVGPDVIVVHRLLKNTAAEAIASRGYLLLTQACVDAIGVEPEELGMTRQVERYDDVGEVVCWLEDLRARWEEEQRRTRVYVAPEEASFDVGFTTALPRELVWDWLTSPARQGAWKGDKILQVAGGGRQQTGATNHCLHGEQMTVEEIVDWKPFDYYTARYEMPVVGPLLVTYELSGDGETVASFRGEGFEGDRAEAWAQVGPTLVSMFEGMGQALKQAMR